MNDLPTLSKTTKLQILIDKKELAGSTFIGVPTAKDIINALRRIADSAEKELKLIDYGISKLVE